MPLSRNRLLRAASVLVLALPAALANATLPRTFVSPPPLGDDANVSSSCSLPTPCRTFAVAMSVTNDKGEIVVLDSAGYGTVTINKSVSIVAPPGIYAGLFVSSGNGVTINTPGVNVTLKGLTINGQGSGSAGIQFTQGARLDIDGCTVVNMGAQGIRVDAPGTVTIANTTVRGNTDIGIFVNAAATVTIVDSIIEANGDSGVAIQGGAKATIAQTTVTKNVQYGVYVSGVAAGTRAAVTSSVIADNTLAGIRADALNAADVVRLDIAGSTLARNANGIQVNSVAAADAKAGVLNNQIVGNTGAGIVSQGGAGSIVRASWNGIFHNGAGFVVGGSGVIYSPVTNYVRDNTTDGTATADSLL